MIFHLSFEIAIPNTAQIEYVSSNCHRDRIIYRVHAYQGS